MTAAAEPIVCPFTVLIDTAESQPFSFQGLRADADKLNLPIVVKTAYSNLGRHPNSLGDYSIAGLQREVAIERKSMEDAHGTILGWETDYQAGRGISGRRQRFEQELANLAGIPAGIVVVEATLEDCLQLMPTWGVKPASENRKIFFRSIISFQQRFKVNWQFCSSRRAAEVFAFRWLERYWKKLTKKQRQEALERAGTV
jgi:hypothetical protein